MECVIDYVTNLNLPISLTKSMIFEIFDENYEISASDEEIIKLDDCTKCGKNDEAIYYYNYNFFTISSLFCNNCLGKYYYNV